MNTICASVSIDCPNTYKLRRPYVHVRLGGDAGVCGFLDPKCDMDTKNSISADKNRKNQKLQNSEIGVLLLKIFSRCARPVSNKKIR